MVSDMEFKVNSFKKLTSIYLCHLNFSGLQYNDPGAKVDLSFVSLYMSCIIRMNLLSLWILFIAGGSQT